MLFRFHGFILTCKFSMCWHMDASNQVQSSIPELSQSCCSCPMSHLEPDASIKRRISWRKSILNNTQAHIDQMPGQETSLCWARYLRLTMGVVAGRGRSIIQARVCWIKPHKHIWQPCRQQLGLITGIQTLEWLLYAQTTAKVLWWQLNKRC